jgi:hypothetical protein
MALTATASQGYEQVGVTTGEEIFWLPGDPGVTFTRGDAVVMSNGVLILYTEGTAQVGTVVETTVCPALATPFPLWSEFNPAGKDSNDLTLIPVKMNTPKGVPIYEVSFANHFDDTVASRTNAYTTVLTTSPGANDDTNAAIIYVYEGPGAGEVNIGDDFVHSGIVLTTHRAFKATLTSASKLIILEGEGGSVGGIGFLGRVAGGDHNNIGVEDGYNDGDYTLFFDYHQAPNLLKNLKLRVVRSVQCGWI